MPRYALIKRTKTSRGKLDANGIGTDLVLREIGNWMITI